MGYAKSYWVPDSEESGSAWRELVNLYVDHDLESYQVLSNIVWHYFHLEADYPEFARLFKEGTTPRNALEYLKCGLEFWLVNWKKLFDEIEHLDDSTLINEKSPFVSVRPVDGDDPKRYYFFSGKYALHRRDLAWFREQYRFPAGFDKLALGEKDFDRVIVDPCCRAIYALTQYFPYILALENLRQIALQVWSVEAPDNRRLSFDQHCFLTDYVRDRLVDLEPEKPSDPDGKIGIDELRIRLTNRLLPTLSGEPLHMLLDEVIGEAVIDLVEDIILYNEFPAQKGSGICQECGQYFPRSFYGHGQKYCSIQCKDRAKKRRQRGKATMTRYLSNKRK